ncbi:Gfo/Idh/MocA family oxidoreductase [Siphonobacter sp. SORGH_AS_0500]|uniref:Gfo/Idh/MocA family protein n=2 Tax=Siphonobacter sp. SORGH_AS_0500 TaxID=1864824 RepID=UPI002855258C|nr:Gfo/Idh/MocA family oxidoreductase [Siphonobacter sp. SORGH_AS_0500]MDR6197342.1 putative dehydrogenase [Siphonobacter sp. SORGH_AS_0500]
MLTRRKFLETSTLAGCSLPFLFHKTSPPEANRIGIIGLDTSHSQIFTKLINEGSYDGFKVVAAYPEGSKDIPSALKLKPGVIEGVKKLGVELVDSIEALLEKVDYVLLETNDGRPHLSQLLPVLKTRKPVFIDKPIAPNLAGAQAIFKAASDYQTPVFSSSALRFEPSVQQVVKGTIGKVLGADVYTPAEIDKNHLDMAWYGIHGVEMLFTLMGSGCKSVSRIHEPDTDLITGVWSDGRIGTVRGIRKGTASIAGTAFGEKGIATLGPFSGYRPLIDEIIQFFKTGKAPVTPEQTLEIFTFMQAADLSKQAGGKRIPM